MTTSFFTRPGRCFRGASGITKPRFQRLLNAGHGRAIKCVLDNGACDYRDVILDMCLHNRAVDYFYEATHGTYVYELLGLIPDRDFFVEQILASLENTADDQDAVHRFFLARLFVKEGHPRAGALMYRHFHPGPQYGETIAQYFAGLDGPAVQPCQAPTIPNARAELRKWGREASREEFLRAAEQFTVSPDPAQLPIFLARPFPLAPAPLIALAAHRDAVLALTHLVHPDIRALAFRLVESNSPNRGFAAQLLFKHSESRDIDIALSWFLAEPDPACRHLLGIALRQQTEAHHIDLYEHTPCSECRSYVVEDLLVHDALPPDYRKECAYDANERTRSLVAS